MLKKGIWNVIVGTNFGSYISYDKGNLMFFNIRDIHFLIFRYGMDDQIHKGKES